MRREEMQRDQSCERKRRRVGNAARVVWICLHDAICAITLIRANCSSSKGEEKKNVGDLASPRSSWVGDTTLDESAKVGTSGRCSMEFKLVPRYWRYIQWK